MIKWLLALAVVGPCLVIFTGVTGNKAALAEAPAVPDTETKRIYVLEHYKMAEPMIVVTVNHFPFDIGGLRPYDINVQGQKFVFKPEHVQEFLSKGRPMQVFHRPLPTGMVYIDGWGQPIDREGARSEDQQHTVLRRENTRYPVVNTTARLR